MVQGRDVILGGTAEARAQELAALAKIERRACEKAGKRDVCAERGHRDEGG